MPPRNRLPAALIAATIAMFAFASTASGATFTVDSNGDGADAALDGVCATGGRDCTLRAAIEEANNSVSVIDTVSFDAGFDGTTANGTITLGSNLPAITDRVIVDGGHCSLSADPDPCAGITGTGTRSISALQVASGGAGSVIENLAFWNLNGGVFLVDGSDFVQANWFGMTLDESTTSAANNNGVVNTDSASNTIGGTTPATRNVFAQNLNAGVLIQGGDSNLVEGNYFGTNRAGSAPVAGFSNGDAIQIFGIGPLDNASGNVIGASHSSTSCDGACNLIANSSDDGIDLSNQGGAGLLPAASTLIKGNYIGLELDGTLGYGGAAGSSHHGIEFGSSSPAFATQVGGASANDRNYFGGYPVGIDTGPVTGSGSTVIRSNYFNVQPDGTGGLPSSKLIEGLAVSAAAGASSAQILDNRLGGSGGTASGEVGIQVYGNGKAVLKRNVLGVDTAGADLPSFTTYAINLDGPSNAIGSTAGTDGNTIGNGSSGGIRVNGTSGNLIQGNFIGTDASGAEDHSNTGPGVLVTGTPDSVVTATIGASTSTGANLVSNNGGDAIRVSRVGGVQIDRNSGSGNGEQFIDLENPSGSGNNVPDGAAEGLQAPVITSFSSTTQASGTASPGAAIRLYAKSSGSAGELSSQLASVIADVGGNWTATFPAQAEGQRLVAAQAIPLSVFPSTPETSELSPVVQLDLGAPPQPTISGTTPGSPSNVDQPAVKGSAEAGSTVRIYSGSDCTGSVLAVGSAGEFAGSGLTPTSAIAHNATTNFRATATDAAGNPSTCSDPFAYTEDSNPPALTIDSAPSAFTSNTSASVTFHATDASGIAGFQCMLTGGSATGCTSPKGYGPLADGEYTITVSATDGAGNVATEPIDFSVDTIDPLTVIDSAPSGTTSDNTPTIAFHTTDVNGASFSCRVDAGSPSPCSSPATFGPLADGAHTISVLATDSAGNVEATPKSASFSVSAPPPTGTGTTPHSGGGGGGGAAAGGKRCKKPKKKKGRASAAKKCTHKPGTGKKKRKRR